MYLARRLAQKGNPMFWPATDAALLTCAMIILMNLFFLSTGIIGEVWPQAAPHIQQPALRQLNLFTIATIAFWLLVGALIISVRRRDPDSHIPGIIITYMFGHPLMVMAYFNGIHSIVTGLLLAASPAFGFVMFKNRHVMNAMLIIWVEIMLLGFAVSFGWISDAPLYGDIPPNRFTEPTWLVMQALIAFPVGLALLMFTRQIVNALRIREGQVRELSRRDSLTGLWNRGYLAELMEREVALAQRNKQPLSLVVADLDLFKNINDKHGHAAGDHALLHAAKTLRSSIREMDHLGRYGGEEFVLVLPNCDLENARLTAERCRQALTAELVDTGKAQVRLSASFGVACICASEIDSDDLFRRADQALYQAKEQGRNQVVVAPAN